MFRRLEAPQSLRDSSLKEGASGKTGKRYGLPGNFAVMPRALPLGELASVARLRGRGRYLRSAFEIVPRKKSTHSHPAAGAFLHTGFNG